jgi:hypothetical protein
MTGVTACDRAGQLAFGYVVGYGTFGLDHIGYPGVAGHGRFTILTTSHFGVAVDDKRTTELFGRDLAFASSCYSFD